MNIIGISHHQVPEIENALRLWFGRMYFPPRDALLQDDSSDTRLTFNEYRQQTYTAFKEQRPCDASTAGCLSSGGRVLLQVIYCPRSGPTE